MAKFATFKPDGFVLRLYDEAIYGPRLLAVYGDAPESSEEDPNPAPPIVGCTSNPEIPAEAVAITDQQWTDIFNNPHSWRHEAGVVSPYEAPATAEDVNRERARRIVAGKTIDGIAVTGRDEDARNLTNLAMAAQLRLGQGDTTTPTVFRDGTNTDHDLTPLQVLSMWQQSATYVSDLYTASWAIKAMDPLPVDVTAAELWPAAT
ncbi:DUF4376 domain-containing protein [Mesorhizobium sp.]|uniref:DUF4376 domain-containing protein n=1 Tax=Mesorhizobium sp. TaxID=1871066 RepID=UPI000FE913A1|nr:DUF4376 domain-containing protein [Mesorhizobium sp.]RWC58936.1 MAG: DUF4376 domain-containing protein [Mesorhizobium sp.]RWC66548.1 MAG: DUF4376 domain-containing protein [Mesorhizobium sp.]